MVTSQTTFEAPKTTLKKPNTKQVETLAKEKVPKKTKESIKAAKKPFKSDVEVAQHPARGTENTQQPKRAPKLIGDVAQKETKVPKSVRKAVASSISVNASGTEPKKLSNTAKQTAKSSREVAKAPKISTPSDDSTSVQFKCPQCSYLNESKASVKQVKQYFVLTNFEMKDQFLLDLPNLISRQMNEWRPL